MTFVINHPVIFDIYTNLVHLVDDICLICTNHHFKEMLHNLTLETSLGTVDFRIFYFSPWLKSYFVLLWTLVVLSNACSLAYIYWKLNLSNVVNLIPLLDCVINLISFIIIAISSLNLWCKAAVLISKTLLLSGKFFETTP